jgi:hypothetical protein
MSRLAQHRPAKGGAARLSGRLAGQQADCGAFGGVSNRVYPRFAIASPALKQHLGFIALNRPNESLS